MLQFGLSTLESQALPLLVKPVTEESAKGAQNGPNGYSQPNTELGGRREARGRRLMSSSSCCGSFSTNVIGDTCAGEYGVVVCRALRDGICGCSNAIQWSIGALGASCAESTADDLIPVMNY